MNERRFEIGTVENGIFLADTISGDPELTGFPTLHLAIQEMREVIRQSEKMWGERMTNGAIFDSETRRIVWVQERDEEPAWRPTHVISRPGQEPFAVMLTEDGVAYTRAEWDSPTSADYEVQDDGEWTFQGQPFDGTVELYRPKETK